MATLTGYFKKEKKEKKSKKEGLVSSVANTAEIM